MAEWSIAAVLKTVEGHTSGGSNPSLSANAAARKAAVSFQNYYNLNTKGEVLEWLKRHAWKACVRQKCTGGSNPPLSAEDEVVTLSCGYLILHILMFLLSGIMLYLTINAHI